MSPKKSDKAPSNYRREKIIRVANEILDMRRMYNFEYDYNRRHYNREDDNLLGAGAALHLALLRFVNEFDLTDEELPLFEDTLIEDRKRLEPESK